MTSPLSRSGVRRWHGRIEQNTPDGVLGRLLFGAVVGLGLGPFLFFAGLVQVIGPTSPLLLSEIVGLVAIPVGVISVLLSLVVLWPVYISITKNLNLNIIYRITKEVHPEMRKSAAEAKSGNDEADYIEALKRRYSTGEISYEEFERKLDDVMNADTSKETRPNGRAIKTDIESRTK